MVIVCYKHWFGATSHQKFQLARNIYILDALKVVLLVSIIGSIAMKLAHFLHLFLLLKTIDDHIFLPIIVYDILTGKIKATLKGHKGCVRDVSWHPYLNEIISSSVSIYLIAITCFNFIEFKIIINIINFFSVFTVYIF